MSSDSSSSNWLVTTMGAAIEWFSSGEAFLKMEYVSEGIPVLSKGDVKPFGRLEHSEKRFINHELAVKRGYRTTRDGDYLLTTRDLTQAANFLGLLARVPTDQKYLINQGANIVRFKPGVNGRFVVYWCNGPIYRAYIKGHCVGSTQIHIRRGDFLEAPLWLPSPDEQHRVVGILGALDERIDLLRETNATLEVIAQTLFKSWFVDFDPVRAKMEGRAPEGMDEATAALFPDSFEESELGSVPRGWTTAPIYDMATFINGAAYKAFEPNAERRGRPIIKIAELKSGVTAQTAYSDVAMPDKYLIETGDILFSWSGNPDTSIDTFVWTFEPAWLNQHIFRVLPRARHERTFVLQMLRHLKPVFTELARNKQTTGLGHVTVADMKREHIAMPTSELLTQLDFIVGPIHARIFENERQAQTLATLRDTLLPRLISGQLRLREVLDQVEDAMA